MTKPRRVNSGRAFQSLLAVSTAQLENLAPVIPTAARLIESFVRGIGPLLVMWRLQTLRFAKERMCPRGLAPPGLHFFGSSNGLAANPGAASAGHSAGPRTSNQCGLAHLDG